MGIWFSWKYRLGSLFWSGSLRITQIYCEYSFLVKQLKASGLSHPFFLFFSLYAFFPSLCSYASPFMEYKPGVVGWPWLAARHLLSCSLMCPPQQDREIENRKLLVQDKDRISFTDYCHRQNRLYLEKLIYCRFITQ